jgi:hypothetical protein
LLANDLATPLAALLGLEARSSADPVGTLFNVKKIFQSFALPPPAHPTGRV